MQAYKCKTGCKKILLGIQKTLIKGLKILKQIFIKIIIQKLMNKFINKNIDYCLFLSFLEDLQFSVLCYSRIG